MTREQAKQNLAALGVSDPTDDQVTNYLNQLGGETKKANERADRYKADADKLVELQKEFDALSDKNLTDKEKAEKERDTALNSVKDLQAQIKTMQLKTQLADKGITGENADKLIESLGAGNVDVELLAQIISEKETAAATAKELEIAKKSTNPNGGSAGSAGTDKTNAEKVAETIGKSLSGANKASADIISNYTN